MSNRLLAPRAPAIILPRYGEAPRWPFVLNKDSQQAQGLVSCWPLLNDVDCFDLGPTNANGAASGAQPTLGSLPDFGAVGPSFNTNSCFELPRDVPAYEALDAGYVSFWFRTPSWGSSGSVSQVFGHGSTYHSSTRLLECVSLFNDGGARRLRIWFRPASSGVKTSGTFELNTTYHVMAGTNGSTWGIWVNGEPQALTLISGSNSGAWIADVGAIDVGYQRAYTLGGSQRGTSPSGFFPGVISSVVLSSQPPSDDLARAYYDPRTRWDLYYEPGRKLFFFPSAGGGGGTTVTPGTASLSFTGYAPTVQVTANVNVAPGTAAMSLTGQAPTVQATGNVWVAPGVAQLALTGFAPVVGVTDHVTVAPGVAQMSLTGFAPVAQVSAHVSVSPGVSGLTLTGFAPAASVSADRTIPVGPAEMSLTGFAPSASLGPLTVAPGSASLQIDGYAVTVDASADVTVQPGVASLTITGYAPGVTAGADVTIQVPAAELTIAGHAPVIALGPLTVAPGTASLILTGFAPSILGVTPPNPGRTYLVPARSGSFAVPSRGSFTVSARNRTFTVH